MMREQQENIMQNQISEQKARLEKRMRELAAGDICLAFSGGVDSSLLLKAAVDAVAETGKKVYAVTFDSRLHPACDLEIAGQVAKELGGIHQVISIDELEQADIRMNPKNRCYLCKRRLFSSLKEFAEEKKSFASFHLNELRVYGQSDEAWNDARTALEEAIQRIETLDLSQYTEQTAQVLQEQMNAAQALLADGSISTDELNTALVQLEDAAAALQIRASQAAMDALQTAVDNAAALKDDYSEEDFADVQAAITAAQALLDDPANASSTAVVSAMLDLSQAVSELPEEGASDKLRENLKATIDYINEHILTNVDNVRPGKVQELKTAVAEAYQVYLDADATDEEIQTAIRTLTEKAQELWEIVSKAELNALIETAEAIEADGYTEMSYRALQAAITAAKTVAANDDATTSEVTTAITDLASAIAGLEQITLDTSALEHEIELAEQILANIDDYVASTVEGLQEKADAAKAALDDAASQAEIDEATKTLREARLSARTKADTSALEALIAEVNAMDLSKYTDASVSGLRTTLFQAQQIIADEEAAQQDVDDALKMLDAAVSALSEKASTQAGGQGDTGVRSGMTAMAGLMLLSAGMVIFPQIRKSRHLHR